MGSKAFLRDVEAAAFCCGKDHVSYIERGKLEGEFQFIFSHQSLAGPLQIRALSKGIADYPSSGFLLFADPSELATWAIPVLHDASQRSNNSSALQLVQDVSKKLIDLVNAHLVSGTPRNMSFPDRPFPREGDVEHQVRKLSLLSTPMQQLEMHFTALRTAGLFAGFIGSGIVKEDTIFYISVPISSLNISPDMLHYWNFGSADHIVLLMRFPKGYPTLDEYCKFESEANAKVQFRIGRCARQSPSLASATNAFDLENMGSKSAKKVSTSRSDMFQSMHLFYSIGKQLTTALPQLICLRRNNKMSWDEAHKVLSDMSGDSAVKTVGSEGKAAASEPSYFTEQSGLSKTLTDDVVMAPEESFNLPMVAIQFALRRFARCTDFCIVCHAKIENGYESAKPYVCSKDLCQFQLIEFGFGYDLEHEITHHPYVVDLLINFYLASVLVPSRTQPQLPLGLQLKVPSFGHYSKGHEVCKASIAAQLDVDHEELTVTRRDEESWLTRIRPGTSLVAVLTPTVNTAAGLWQHENLTSYLCSVREVLRSDAHGNKTLNCKLAKISHIGTHRKGSKKPQHAALYFFDHDLAKLPPCTLGYAIKFLGRLIPSVLEMRDYVMNEGRPLKEWHRLHPSALSLLNWIVASNRSYLVQNEEVPHSTAAQVTNTSKSTFGPRVRGIGKKWMQFRFIQGSPEKEAEFRAATQCPEFLGAVGERLPSLYAWHGSPFSNWHGIVREGLNFKKVTHGRSQGHGIYLSNQFSTSLAYAGAPMDDQGQPLKSSLWKNSELHPTRAISICEVVNWPERFVAQSPYVVNKTGWVQCRYLLVRVRPSARAMENPLLNETMRQCRSYIQQDPKRMLYGPKSKVSIPFVGPPKPFVAATVMNSHPERLNLKRPPLSELLSRRAEKLRDTGNGTAVVSKASSNATPFTPGSLKWEGLAKMPAPEWAASSPQALSRLNRDVKSLQVVQSKTPLAELGWHVNFSELENVFQWVVELHSFPDELPLARDMREMDCESIVLEMRFGGSYPNSPPFVRVVQPIFVSFADGGGGHVTLGGAICSELLTSTGWKKDLSLEQVIMNVRLGLCDKGRPARLAKYPGSSRNHYAIRDAVEAFRRACRTHGWVVPKDLQQILKN